MTRQEFDEAARRYREELFRLYAARQLDPPPKPEAVPEPVMQQAPPQNIPEEPPQETAVGEPEIPAGPGTAPEETAVKPETGGGILVHVRTAGGARPVPGATVLITQQQGTDTVLIALQLTDACGDTGEVHVSAPPSQSDQQFPPYASYNVTVHAEGYYRETSADVPVFEGVVSVQSFDLIPLPAGQTDTLAGEQTFYNDMPRP